MPRKFAKLPDRDTLMSWVRYDPETGELFPLRDFVSIYDLSGGYRQVYARGSRLCAHRVIWKIVTGEDPSGEVDHRDGKTNRWSNLRLATSAQNNQNRKISKRNKSGVKGVMWESARGRWRASVGRDGRPLFWMARFKTFDEACRAVAAKRRELHSDFARS